MQPIIQWFPMPETLVDQLANEPETGMGYQVVHFTLNDASTVDAVISGNLSSEDINWDKVYTWKVLQREELS